jgi:hypothetical protein
MGYGDEKVIVDVKDVDHGEILYTDKEGKEHTYYPCRSIWLEVETLEVLTFLGEPKDGAEPPLVTKVRGTATLEDRSISVIGDTKSRVRRLTISLDACDWKPKPEEPKAGEFPSLHSALGGAELGFNRGDWEIGNNDEWWICCYLPKAFIDALVTDIRREQIGGMKLSLALRGLYTTEHSWAPVSSRGDLFIRPDRRDNSLAIPDMAQGHVCAIHFTSASRDLRKPEPVEQIEPEDEEVPPAPAPDPVAVAIAALGVRVDQMRSTLKWVGGFIVLALLFIAGR